MVEVEASTAAVAASMVAEDISAASMAVVFMAVASAPRRPFTAAAIAMADFIAMVAIAPPSTGIATSIGASTAAIIPIIVIRAAAGSSGPFTARTASAAGIIGIAGTIRTAIGNASLARHARACPGHPRSFYAGPRTWMAGT